EEVDPHHRMPALREKERVLPGAAPGIEHRSLHFVGRLHKHWLRLPDIPRRLAGIQGLKRLARRNLVHAAPSLCPYPTSPALPAISSFASFPGAAWESQPAGTCEALPRMWGRLSPIRVFMEVNPSIVTAPNTRILFDWSCGLNHAGNERSNLVRRHIAT